jgi:hypothetical protein
MDLSRLHQTIFREQLKWKELINGYHAHVPGLTNPALQLGLRFQFGNHLFVALEKHNCHYADTEKCFFEVIGVLLGMESIYFIVFSFCVLLLLFGT